MLQSKLSTAIPDRLNETDNQVKGIFTVLDNNHSIGKRLVEAFNTDDKAFIAEKLGFSSVQAVYKVINGDRELDFEKLQNFRNYTKCSIDWLLTGEGEKFLNENKRFDVEKAVLKYETLEETVEAWYQFEGKEIPEDFALNFHFWKDLSLNDKIQTVKDIKTFTDRMNEKIDRGEIDYD